MLGHNQPPSDLEIVQARLAERDASVAIDSIAIVDSVTADNRDKAADSIKVLRDVKKRVATIHKDVKAPYLECGKAVDTWKNSHEAKIDKAITQAEKPLMDFIAELERVERERRLAIAQAEMAKAEALAAEAAAHSNAGLGDVAKDLMDAALSAESMSNRISHSAIHGKSNDIVKVRTDGGTVASVKTKWVGEVIDRSVVNLETLRNYLDIQGAVERFVRDGGRVCEGVVIKEISAGLNIR